MADNCAGGSSSTGSTSTGGSTSAGSSGGGTNGGIGSGMVAVEVGCVFWVILENDDDATTISSGGLAPYLAQTLPTQGALFMNCWRIIIWDNDARHILPAPLPF